MILRPEDPCQICFVCRSELVADEPLVLTVGQVVDGLDLRVLYSRYSEAGRSFFDPAMMLKLLFFVRGRCPHLPGFVRITRILTYNAGYRLPPA